jgi:hypothetical protein
MAVQRPDADAQTDYGTIRTTGSGVSTGEDGEHRKGSWLTAGTGVPVMGLITRKMGWAAIIRPQRDSPRSTVNTIH